MDKEKLQNYLSCLYDGWKITLKTYIDTLI